MTSKKTAPGGTVPPGAARFYPASYRVIAFPHHEGAAALASTTAVFPQAHL